MSYEKRLFNADVRDFKKQCNPVYLIVTTVITVINTAVNTIMITVFTSNANKGSRHVAQKKADRMRMVLSIEQLFQ